MFEMILIACNRKIKSYKDGIDTNNGVININLSFQASLDKDNCIMAVCISFLRGFPTPDTSTNMNAEHFTIFSYVNIRCERLWNQDTIGY